MDKQKTLNALAKGAGWAAIGMVVSKFMTFTFRAVIARFLDPSAYGQFSLGLSVLVILNSIAFLAMGSAAKKYISEYLTKDDFASVKGAIYSSFGLVLPFSLLATAVMFFGADFIAYDVFNTENPQQLKTIIQILAFVPPLGNLLDLSEAIVLAYKKVKYEVLTEMLFRNFVQLLVTAVLLVLGFNIISAAWGWLIAVLFALVLILYLIEFRLGPIVRSSTKPNLMPRKMLNFSAPLVLGSIIGTILGHTDTLMLGYFLTDTQVGIYNVALPIAVLIKLPYEALGKLALPSISEMKEQDEKEIPDIIKTLTRWSIAVSFPIFAVVALFPEQTIQLLFGNQYVAGATALIILAFGRFVKSATGHMGSIIQTYEETQIIFKNSFAKFIINVGLNLLLIPIIGIIGAAIATAGTMIFMNLLIVAEVYH
ncbi:MAG: O-antigen/teichoic acid export membrane protein, partial [Candidatus Nanohaloarchaea archaeon]